MSIVMVLGHGVSGDGVLSHRVGRVGILSHGVRRVGVLTIVFIELGFF